MDASVTVTSVLRSQRDNGLCQRIFVSTQNDRVTLRATRLANEPAGLTLRENVLLPDPPNCLPAPFGAYKFPEAISFRTCFSRDKSATSRFSRVFSFSMSFIRRA